MPAVSLAATVARAIRQIDILEDYYKTSSVLEPRFQCLVAEVITLRLFAVLEDGIAELACKLAMGARYLSGRSPLLFVRSRSLNAAQGNLANYGRQSGIQLRWSKASYIRGTVRYVFDPAEPFNKVAIIYGNIINEMRVVRNYVAHKNESTRKAFKVVIRQRFGGTLRISAGSFLIATKRLPVPIMREYLVQTRVVLHDFAAG